MKISKLYYQDRQPKERIFTRANLKDKSSGFTIIELTIATMIFSVILLLVTYGILQIGRTYTKGVTESKTQQTARAVMDAITQDIQFYKSGVVAGANNGGVTYVICVGNNRYTAFLSKVLVDSPPPPDTLKHQSNYALLFDANLASCNTSVPATLPPPSSSVELLTTHMRIAAIDITPQPITDLFAVHVRVVYGQDDVLCSPSVAGDCNAPGISTNLANDDIACKGGVINQFCAVSDLRTTIQKRVN